MNDPANPAGGDVPGNVSGTGDNAADNGANGNNADQGLMADVSPPEPDPAMSQPGPGNPDGGGGDDQNGDGNPQNDAQADGPYHPDGLEDAMRGDTDRDTIDKLQARVTGLRAKLGAGGEKVPDAPDGYKFTAPEGSDMDLSDPVNAPMIAATAAAAHKVGMPADMAAEFVSEIVTAMPDVVANTPAPEMDMDAEWKKLGGKEKAMPMASGVLDWINGLGTNGELSPAEVDEAKIMAGTAAGLTVMNKLRSMAGAKPIPRHVPGEDGGLHDRDTLRSMMADDRYETDPGYRKKVEKAYRDFYGPD